MQPPAEPKRGKTDEAKRAKADDAKPASPQSELLQTTFKGHTGEITCAVFSPNGKYLATTSEDRTVRVFHKDSCVATLRRPYRLPAPCSPHAPCPFEIGRLQLLPEGTGWRSN